MSKKPYEQVTRHELYRELVVAPDEDTFSMAPPSTYDPEVAKERTQERQNWDDYQSGRLGKVELDSPLETTAKNHVPTTLHLRGE